MGKQRSAGKPTTHRYSETEKAQAVRMVRQLRKELGHDHGTVGRVAGQLGIGVESLRSWVKQAEIDDGLKPGLTSAEAVRIRELEQEVKELRRANEILKRASAFFASLRTVRDTVMMQALMVLWVSNRKVYGARAGRSRRRSGP